MEKNMMEDLKYKWEQIDEDDYVAKYRDMKLRVEKMDEQQWWWAVYRGKEELCPEKPFARKKDYAMKMAEECAEENIEPYVSDDFQIGPDGAYEHIEQQDTSRKQNSRILSDLLNYLKEQHSNLPSHVFEVLGEVIDDLKQ